MIIRHRHKGKFTVVPNAIFNDDSISLSAKGLLGYLLSRPGNWDVRHDQLQRKLGIGRKLLTRLFKELENEGYLDRDEEQGRDGYNRFTTLNYVVRDIAEPPITDAPITDAPIALHPEPQREKDTDTNKEEIKTDSNKPFPKPPSPEQVESKRACQDKFSDMGERALANGMHPVFIGSKAYQAWLAKRGADGMPGFVDRAMIDGKLRQVVWMPSVFPLKNSGEFNPEDGEKW
jgi:hypothetical protein